MMPASTPFCSGLLARTALLFSLLLGCGLPAAFAHKASDAYLQLKSAGTQGIELRWDISLRDLDAALDMDVNGDGQLTWGEVKTAWGTIEDYALSNIAIPGCTLRSGGGSRALERRSDGAYAVLMLTSGCALASELSVRYSLFSGIDNTHRGILRVVRGDGSVSVILLAPRRLTNASPDADTRAPANQAFEPASSASFLLEGVHHIVTGYDHLLFLLCMVLPAVMRRDGNQWHPVNSAKEALLPVIVIVTGFTVAHSTTLTLAALKLISLPTWFIEPAIAATIVIAAIDNLRPIFFGLHRGIVAFAFGLIHGFGFANVLGELNLPALQFAWALLQFNVGLELGQLFIVTVVVGLLYLLRQQRGYSRWVVGGGSLAAIVVGTLWFAERTTNLSLPSIDSISRSTQTLPLPTFKAAWLG